MITENEKIFPDFSLKNCLTPNLLTKRLSMDPDISDDVADLKDFYEVLGGFYNKF
jgi:hypothetical protein